MNSLLNYINNDIQYINFVNESLENNTRIINETQLLLDHAKELDKIWYKVRCSIQQEYNYSINENRINYINTIFTKNESNIVRNLLVCFVENYKESLLEDSKIYEALLNNDETILEELQITKQFKELAKQGKDKLNKLYDNIKTKIDALNDFIRDLFNQTIKSIKDVANKAIQLIEKLGESLFEIAQKIGFKNDQIEELSDELIKDLKNNKEVIVQTNVYESYANELQKQINEGIVDKVNDVKNWFSKTKVGKFAQTPVGKMVLSLINWGLVCVVLPGIVAAILPSGALFTLIFPVIVKFVWNLKKFKKLVNQTRDLIRRFDTLTTWDKIVNGILLLLNIGAFVFNLISIGSNLIGKGILDEFLKACKSGDLLSKLFTENGAAGIEPDALTTFAAVWIKKLAVHDGSLDQIREKFLSGFQKIPAVSDAAQELANTVSDAANNINQSTEELTNSVKDKINNYTGRTSRGLWDEIWKLCNVKNGKPDVSNLDNDTVYKIIVDGTATDKAKWVVALKNRLKESGANEELRKKAEDLLNKALNSTNSNAGSTTILDLPGEIIKQNQDILGATTGMKNGSIFAVLGPIKEITKNIPKDPEVVKQFFKHMLFDVPLSDLYIPKGKGFIVRLGNESQKDHYEYRIEKDGLYLEKKLNELKNEKGISKEDYKKIETEYNKLIEILTEENNKILKQVLESNKKSTEEIKKEIEDNKDKYKEKLKEIPVTVFCGKRWNEEENNDKQVTDSYKSLYDYIISEAKTSKYSIDDIKQNFIDLKKLYLTKIGNENNKVTNDQEKGDFKGNTQMILGSIFTLNDKYKTSKFKWKEDYEPTPYELVKKRANDNNKTNDVFGPEDIELLAVHYCVWHGPDNEKTYKAYVKAFIDAAILKGQFMDNENEDIIIASYKRLIDNLLKIESIANDVKDKDWKPKQEWAPIKIDEDDIDSKTLKKVKDTENNDAIETSKKKAEDELEDTNAPLPAEQDNDDNSDKKENDTEKDTDDKNTDDGNIHPVLLFVNCYGKDIAPYKGSKVREKFSMKGLMRSLFFKEYKKGMAIPDIKTMFGEILYNMTEQIQGISALPPIVIKKNWWKDKKVLNDKVAGDDERIDFGYLKNKDVVDILNNKKNAEKYVDLKSSITDILDTEEDKKELKQKQKDYNKQLENPDKETIKLVKKIDPEGIDKDGKIINKDEIANTLASYSVAKGGAKRAKKSKGGLFSKIKNWVKSKLFGDNIDTGEKYVDLLNHLETSENLSDIDNNLITENLTENINFLNECFEKLTLTEYIKLKGID